MQTRMHVVATRSAALASRIKPSVSLLNLSIDIGHRKKNSTPNILADEWMLKDNGRQAGDRVFDIHG